MIARFILKISEFGNELISWFLCKRVTIDRFSHIMQIMQFLFFKKTSRSLTLLLKNLIPKNSCLHEWSNNWNLFAATLQKYVFYTWWNVKHFKFCYIFGIRKPKEFLFASIVWGEAKDCFVLLSSFFLLSVRRFFEIKDFMFF